VIVKYLAVLFVSIFFAGIAAVGVSIADPPSAEAAGGGYAPKCGGGRIFLNAEERRTFTLHNSARRNSNLRAFCVHPDLQQAARAHTRDMVRRNYFSHTTKGTNIGPCERIRRQGYRYRYCAENIGYHRTPDLMFKAWKNSRGHWSNIMNNKYREIGIGAARKDARNTMFTVDFGTRF
jgi:uncharacterized protein YkwD